MQSTKTKKNKKIKKAHKFVTKVLSQDDDEEEDDEEEDDENDRAKSRGVISDLGDTEAQYGALHTPAKGVPIVVGQLAKDIISSPLRKEWWHVWSNIPSANEAEHMDSKEIVTKLEEMKGDKKLPEILKELNVENATIDKIVTLLNEGKKDVEVQDLIGL